MSLSTNTTAPLGESIEFNQIVTTGRAVCGSFCDVGGRKFVADSEGCKKVVTSTLHPTNSLGCDLQDLPPGGGAQDQSGGGHNGGVNLS